MREFNEVRLLTYPVLRLIIDELVRQAQTAGLDHTSLPEISALVTGLMGGDPEAFHGHLDEVFAFAVAVCVMYELGRRAEERTHGKN